MFGIKTKFIEFITRNIFPYFGPELIRIQPVGFRCNHNCPMCWRLKLSQDQFNKLANAAENQDLSFDKYQKMIKTLPFTVKKVEVVGGGEPLLYPEIMLLFELIKDRDFYGSLITNGVLLKNQMVEHLCQISWDYIRISFNAARASTYQKVNGADDFDTVLNNIRYLVELRDNNRPEIYLHFVIQKGNSLEVAQFVRLAENLGVDGISLDTLTKDSPSKVRLNSDQLPILLKELNKVKQTSLENNVSSIIADIKKNLSEGGRTRDYFEDKYCSIVQTNLDISGSGEVVPCCLAFDDFDSLNIKKNSWRTIWREYRTFRRDLKKGKFKQFCYELCNYELPRRKKIKR